MNFRPFSLLSLFPALLPAMAVSASAAPQLPGLSADADPEIKGQVLIEELNCAACHSGGEELKAASKKAPRLAAVGSRVNPASLEVFLSDPHGVKPGTTMPDVMSPLGVEERKLAATELTHFLLSLKKNDFAPEPPDSVAAARGKQLFHSRGCASCHAPRDDKAAELPMKNSVPLGALEKKYSFKSLTSFLQQPHLSRPSIRMPDMMLSGQDVERIAHFLLQGTKVPGKLAYTLYRGNVWEGLNSAEVTAERAGHVGNFALTSLGKVQHHTAIRYDGWMNLAHAGRYKFFLTMNGGSLAIDGSALVEQEPSDRRGVKELNSSAELAAGWRRIELTYFHTGRDAKFSFEMEGPQFARQAPPPSMLSVASEHVPTFAPLKADLALATRGRARFATIGCANCHDDLQVPPVPATPLVELDASRGCLSFTAGAWPRFDLSNEQLEWIRTALPQAEKPEFNDKQRIDKTLLQLNCIACHERTGLGGIAPERNPLFTGTQPGLGDQGRLPPPLSHVGAKLQPRWIREVLLNGKRQRNYLDASMPQFGEANVGHLADLFGKVDKLEEATLPKVTDILESKDAGYQMVGTNGLGCIACHEFNGQKAGEMSALDIANVTDRLQKNWFALYMRQPSRFHPTVIMPSYWPDGKAVRPNILGGNTALQIEALWTYLADGERAKKPAGLSRQSNELRVGDVTEICRGQSPVGYRGIGVGYPERISLAFDSGEMALRQLWKGEFASVDLGHFRPSGTDPITFPPGIPFHRLKSMDDNWPYKGKTNHAFPQDHGYQFRGYHLDAARRPALRYQYGDIAVEDHFTDLLDKDKKAYFRRTLNFDAPATQSQFYFRVAAGKEITAVSERVFKAGPLELRITGEQKGIVRSGEPAEVLIPLTLPAGRTKLTLEYQW